MKRVRFLLDYIEYIIGITVQKKETVRKVILGQFFLFIISIFK